MVEGVDYRVDALSPFELLVIGLIVLFGLIALASITHVLVLMLIRTHRERWVSALGTRTEDGISIWLAGDYSTEELTIRFRQAIAKDRRAEGVILKVLFATSKLFRPEGQSVLRELMVSLNLHRLCYKLLRSRHWQQQAYATQIISQLQMALALPLLKRKLRTKNTVLRLELIIAMVALGNHDWLQDVQNTNTRLSDWEQILLLERFRRLNTDQLPSFDIWLTATHADWILFGIRLCRHFNRFDRVQEMGALLRHEDKRIQMAVLDAFYYLGSPENIPFLTDYIQQATDDRLVFALKVLGNQGDPDVIDFLLPYTAHADASVQLSALGALKEMGLSKEELRPLTTDPRYINHLFDPKLI